jgi:hypothetical protein
MAQIPSPRHAGRATGSATQTGGDGFVLEEGERGRGMGGPAWAERPSGAGWFQGKGARATRRMHAKM